MLNTDTNYTYSITTELYDIDYGCVKPELYLEQTNHSVYEQLLKNSSDMPTRITSTSNPELLIREDKYNISFNYDVKNGEQIVIKFLDIDNKEKYAIVINHESKEFYFIQNKTLIKGNLTLKNSEHFVRLEVSKDFMNLKIDNNIIKLQTPKDYTKGFIGLETTDSYAEITNMYIERRNVKQYVSVKVAEAKYQEFTLEQTPTPETTIEYSKFLSNQLLYYKIMQQPLIQSINKDSVTRYYNNLSYVNITDSTLQASFKNLQETTIGLENVFEILYNSELNTLTFNNPLNLTCLPNQTFHVSKASDYSELKIIFGKNDAKIYFNNEYVTHINNLTLNLSRPYIQGMDAVSIKELSLKSNINPITINYVLPKVAQSVSYSTIYTAESFNTIRQLIINKTANGTSILSITPEQKATIQDFYHTENINWTNYRITATYQDITKDNTFKLSLNSLEKSLYNVVVDAANKKAFITYNKDNKSLTITKDISITGTQNKLQIDANNNSLAIVFDSQTLVNTKADQYNNGILVMDYKNITLTSAQVENRDTGAIIIYKKLENTECKPIMKDRFVYQNSQIIKQGQTKKFNSYLQLSEPFDIAKVQVSLTNANITQEIHFWVKNLN